MDVSDEDKEYFFKNGILPQYAHLKGLDQNMPVIRKLLGLPEHGRIPQDTAIGRALQRFVENDSKNVLREGITYQHPPLE